MSKVEDFYQISDAEEYFEFFDLAYDSALLDVKRSHIMRQFGKMLQKAREIPASSEEERLKYYKFALLSVYKEFESGYSPSAAEIWDMDGRTLPCQSCKSACMEEGSEAPTCC
ncbi:MAG: nitrogen fixation protein NifW [Campylobacterales bacterium]|nr:nitrogen fixation protein NifW [Campylobacterales bacterium]